MSDSLEIGFVLDACRGALKKAVPLTPEKALTNIRATILSTASQFNGFK